MFKRALKLLTFLVNSGPPLGNLPTGIAISQDQSAAIQISVPKPCIFISAHMYLSSPLIEDDASISLALCQDANGLPDEDNCLEMETLSLPKKSKRSMFTWISDLKPRLDVGEYWVVMSGNAPDFDSSFSWMDAENFNATTAFKVDGGWTSEGEHPLASTLIVVVN
jgi:hypothetical protein